MTNIAADAHHAFEDLKQDMKDHNLSRVIADIEAEKKSRSPEEYGKFMAAFNKEVATILPGLTIEGTKTQFGGKPDLVVKDYDSTNYLGSNEENRLENISKNRITETPNPDGSKTIRQPDGSTWTIKDDGKGNWDGTSTGPKPGDNYTVYNRTNGKEVTQDTHFQDGRETTNVMQPNGEFREHGVGPKPHDNYESEMKNGHLTIRYADGHGMEAYHDANGKYIVRNF